MSSSTNSGIQFFIQNRLNVSFDVDAIRFFIRNKQKSKRTATQETEIRPLYVYPLTNTVKGKHAQTFMIALPKFTLPDEKFLSVQMLEKNGGRNLPLSLTNTNFSHLFCQVELSGIEPLSKHNCHKLSTCLVYYYLSAHNRK